MNREQEKRFVSIRSNRHKTERLPHLYSPPEVKIREITIHEPSSFLKRGHKLQSIRTIRVDSIKSTRIDNIFNPPSKYRSTIFSKSRTNRLPACRIDRRGNDSCWFDGIGFTNRFPVCRIANTKTNRLCMYVCMYEKCNLLIFLNSQKIHWGRSLASSVVLWSSWHWKDFHYISCCQTDLFCTRVQLHGSWGRNTLKTPWNYMYNLHKGICVGLHVLLGKYL